VLKAQHGTMLLLLLLYAAAAAAAAAGRGLYDGTAFYRLADRVGNPWYGMAKRRDAVNNQHLG